METPKSLEVAPVDTWQTLWHDKARLAVLSLTMANGKTLSFALPPEMAQDIGKALVQIGERAIDGRVQQSAPPPS